MKPRTLILVLLLSLFTTLAGADPSRKQAVVGKWSFTDASLSGSLEFSAAGAVKMAAQKKSMKRGAVGEGKYEWVDDSTLKLQVIFDGIPKEMTFKIVKLDAKTLVMTDDRGDTKTFKRSK